MTPDILGRRQEILDATEQLVKASPLEGPLLYEAKRQALLNACSRHAMAFMEEIQRLEGVIEEMRATP